MTALPKLRITSTGPMGLHTHVFLDDVEVKGLEAVSLRMATHDVNICQLTICVDRVDIDAETMLQLQAVLDAERSA